MKCPKCQSEIKDNAKFCTKCGCNLAEELAKMKPAAPQQPVQPQVQQDKVCVKCGAPIKPGARFCTKCGTPVAQPAPVQPTVEAPKPAPTPVQPTQTPQPKAATPVQSAPTPQPKAATPVQPAPTPQPKAVTPVQPTPAPQPKAAAPVKPAPAQPKPAPASNKQPKPAMPKDDEKASPALIIVVVVLAVLVIASGIVCFLVWNGTISLPFGGTVTEETTDEEESTEATTEAETSTVDVDELFAETDTLAETGKGQIAVDAEIVDGMNNLNAAIQEYASKAEEAGDISLAVDRINDAYVAYITAIVRHKDIQTKLYLHLMNSQKDKCGQEQSAGILCQKHRIICLIILIWITHSGFVMHMHFPGGYRSRLSQSLRVVRLRPRAQQSRSAA